MRKVDYLEVLELLDRKNLTVSELEIGYKLSMINFDSKEVFEKGTSLLYEEFLSKPGITVDELIDNVEFYPDKFLNRINKLNRYISDIPIIKKSSNSQSFDENVLLNNKDDLEWD